MVDGARPPFLKVRGGPEDHCGRRTWRSPAPAVTRARQPFAPSDIGEAIVGCVIPAPDEEANIAPIVALRLGCGKHVPAYTVHAQLRLRPAGAGLGRRAHHAGLLEPHPRRRHRRP